MFKLKASLKKDFLLLWRDKVGLAFMFLMPVLLVIVITSLQAGTFELVNDNKIHLVVCNKDQGELGQQYIKAIADGGLSEITELPSLVNSRELIEEMHKNDALLAIEIPPDFSDKISEKANHLSSIALSSLGNDSAARNYQVGESLKLFYNPVLQPSYLKSINGALVAALELVQSRQILNTIYTSINDEQMPKDIEKEILQNHTLIEEFPASKSGSKSIPNATQHNVPAWTIFAMFFVVTSLGSGVVKEKLSGSFTRLKTLPSSYWLSLLSKQITYIIICLFQVVVIFSIGTFLFPSIGLPALHLPTNWPLLLVVSAICGWCAVSYAICIGVYAKSQEQANGFGAVSIVILAALGGVLIPSFAMPNSFRILMQLSPLHWCLQSYYELFLEEGGLMDVLKVLLPIVLFTIGLQLLIVFKLKKAQLI